MYVSFVICSTWTNWPTRSQLQARYDLVAFSVLPFFSLFCPSVMVSFTFQREWTLCLLAIFQDVDRLSDSHIPLLKQCFVSPFLSNLTYTVSVSWSLFLELSISVCYALLLDCVRHAINICKCFRRGNKENKSHNKRNPYYSALKLY